MELVAESERPFSPPYDDGRAHAHAPASESESENENESQSQSQSQSAPASPDPTESPELLAASASRRRGRFVVDDDDDEDEEEEDDREHGKDQGEEKRDIGSQMRAARTGAATSPNGPRGSASLAPRDPLSAAPTQRVRQVGHDEDTREADAPTRRLDFADSPKSQDGRGTDEHDEDDEFGYGYSSDRGGEDARSTDGEERRSKHGPEQREDSAPGETPRRASNRKRHHRHSAEGRTRAGRRASKRHHHHSRRAVFFAQIGNALTVVNGLRGVFDGRRDQHALVAINLNSMSFTAMDNSKSCQGTATLHERLFDEWEMADDVDRVAFRINLAVLLDCLGCLGMQNLAHTLLRLEYDEDTFKLVLMEGTVVNECKIRTIVEEDEDGGLLDFAGAFRAVGVKNRAILPSEHLRDAFSELSELPGATTVSVLMSPQRPFFRLSAQGQNGSCEIEFPHGHESFTQLMCEVPLEFEYRLSLLQHAGRALATADKTFLRMNQDGMLSIQHMMVQSAEGGKTYVDFFVLADITDNDEEEEDDEGQA